MNLAEKEKFEIDKEKSPTNSFDSTSIPSDWRFSRRIGDSSAGILHRETLLGFCKVDMAGTSSSSAPVAVADSFLQSSWDHVVGSQPLGVCDSSRIGIQPVDPLRSCCMNSLLLDRPNSIPRNCIFSPNIVGVLPPPQSLSQFPSDSAFIERAARFSNLNGGNFSDIGNPFPIPETLYSEGGGVNRGSQDFTALWRSPMRAHGLTNEVNMGEMSKGASLCSDHDVAELRRPGNDMDNNEFLVRDHNPGVDASTNGSDEAEVSGDAGQDETSMFDCTSEQPNSIKRVGSKKRKKILQDAEVVQLKGPDLRPESSQKAEQNPATTTSNKSLPKPTKNGSQASEIPKEEYIHVRARRGQATNSHSLAERVRREKISERMKFLQDLVPGCSKVTGKAVMLDEIINYVQSLQRQVEFLSMKLATVNPRSDFNFEGLHEKNVADSLPVVGFSAPDLVAPFQQLPPAVQPGIVQSGIFCLRNQVLGPQLPSVHPAAKKPQSSTQMGGSMWEDELHNIVQMSIVGGSKEEGSGTHLDPPLTTGVAFFAGSTRQDHMKIKL